MSICAQDSYNREVENSQLKLYINYSKVFRRNRMRSMLLAISFLTIAPVYGNRVADERNSPIHCTITH